MDDRDKLELCRRSVGPWISQFENNGCSTNGFDEGFEDVSTSNYIRNSQGVFIKRKRQPKKKEEDKINSSRNKLRYDPSNDEKIKGDPHRTVFIARLDFNTTEETLFEMFDSESDLKMKAFTRILLYRYGSIEKLRLVKDVKTGKSKGYAFVEFSDESEVNRALRETKDERLEVDGRKVLVDRVRAGVTPSWLPRRLGGGLGQRQKGTQRFAWKLAYFGDTSRIDHAEIYRKQELWLEHNRFVNFSQLYTRLPIAQLVSTAVAGSLSDLNPWNPDISNLQGKQKLNKRTA
ncbi:hypothetical protein OS493_029927 [Desmophyllum pertusum]|uniref:RRM domain-containing protein n=1 Tax=Desmophyllum pertusum TaxID=174260 RepID=A0A9W9Y8U8_9CNID|nr:hypothetical protein OS493_029927 [Desmophyllum pertusum]